MRRTPTRPATSRSCTRAEPSAGSPPAATPIPTASRSPWATSGTRSPRRSTASRSRSWAKSAARAGSKSRCSTPTGCGCALDRRRKRGARYGKREAAIAAGRTRMAKKGLLERLAEGPVICAEGYLFELERRGYLQAGAYVPEVVLDHPELVSGLHREFVHAGSDVVEAFTYYAHREKLRILGKEHLLEAMNRQALSLAAEVAAESGALLAGNVCNTNAFDPAEPAAVAG